MVSACVEKNARLFVRIGIFNKKKVGSRQFGGLWKKNRCIFENAFSSLLLPFGNE